MKLVDIDTRITALLWDDEHEEETTREMTIGAFLDEFTVEGLLEIPILFIPPHGRLIDADKQDAQIEALIERHLHGYTKSTWDFVCELRDILKRNRTIIPADPTEEGE